MAPALCKCTHTKRQHRKGGPCSGKFGDTPCVCLAFEGAPPRPVEPKPEEPPIPWAEVAKHIVQASGVGDVPSVTVHLPPGFVPHAAGFEVRMGQPLPPSQARANITRSYNGCAHERKRVVNLRAGGDGMHWCLDCGALQLRRGGVLQAWECPAGRPRARPLPRGFASFDSITGDAFDDDDGDDGYG